MIFFNYLSLLLLWTFYANLYGYQLYKYQREINNHIIYYYIYRKLLFWKIHHSSNFQNIFLLQNCNFNFIELYSFYCFVLFVIHIYSSLAEKMGNETSEGCLRPMRSQKLASTELGIQGSNQGLDKFNKYYSDRQLDGTNGSIAVRPKKPLSISKQFQISFKGTQGAVKREMKLQLNQSRSPIKGQKEVKKLDTKSLYCQVPKERQSPKNTVQNFNKLKKFIQSPQNSDIRATDTLKNEPMTAASKMIESNMSDDISISNLKLPQTSIIRKPTQNKPIIQKRGIQLNA